MKNKINIQFFYDENGKSYFKKFYQKLDLTYQIFIDKRFKKIEKDEHLGVHKNLGDGIKELKFENNIRIYYGVDNNIFIIILAGSLKDNQQNRISRAKELWKNFEAGKAF
jgi:putative addiction module killer protein